MTLRLLGDRVAIELAPEQDRVGSLYVPDVAKEKPAHGTVVAVGPGSWNEQHWRRNPMGVQVGDDVSFGRYSGTELPGGLLIVREGDVLCVNAPETEQDDVSLTQTGSN
jgi:chaperonin GroES